ncbi:MAG: hypothetical protein R2710_24410 [Acidimicrobiales bacterium]
MINLIGDQTTSHLRFDAPLTSDIDALAGWAGHTVHTASAQACGQQMADAVAFTLSGDERIVSLVMPADHAGRGRRRAARRRCRPRAHPSADAIAEAAEALARRAPS